MSKQANFDVISRHKSDLSEVEKRSWHKIFGGDIGWQVNHLAEGCHALASKLNEDHLSKLRAELPEIIFLAVKYGERKGLRTNFSQEK